MKKRDVDETDDHYEVDIGLPGFRKDDLKLELNDNYLTVSAAKGQESGKKDKGKRLIWGCATLLGTMWYFLTPHRPFKKHY